MTATFADDMEMVGLMFKGNEEPAKLYGTPVTVGGGVQHTNKEARTINSPEPFTCFLFNEC